MKKWLIIVVILGIGILFYFLFFNNAAKEIHKSPGGEYTVEVVALEKGFSMPGNSGKSNTPALVILKDKDGNVIAESSSNPDCTIFMGSVQIHWDLDNDLVWYGKAKMINVKTGEVSC